MISEHISQTFRYDVRDDIKNDIIHDFKGCMPTSKNVLGRALLKSRLAASSLTSSKSGTVIWHPPNKTWLVLCVQRIQTGDVQRRESQSGLCGRRARLQAPPVLVVVQGSRSVQDSSVQDRLAGVSAPAPQGPAAGGEAAGAPAGSLRLRSQNRPLVVKLLDRYSLNSCHWSC